MSGLSLFFAENVTSEVTEEVIVSERFKDEKGKPVPWKIRSMTEAENEEIRKDATRKTKGKNGAMVTETKPDEYMAKLIVSSVMFPPLKDADLQKSYGVIGAEQLLKKMLFPGEYAVLVQAVQSLNGFDKSMEDLIEEVKN